MPLGGWAESVKTEFVVRRVRSPCPCTLLFRSVHSTCATMHCSVCCGGIYLRGIRLHLLPPIWSCGSGSNANIALQKYKNTNYKPYSHKYKLPHTVSLGGYYLMVLLGSISNIYFLLVITFGYMGISPEVAVVVVPVWRHRHPSVRPDADWNKQELETETNCINLNFNGGHI